MQTFKTDLDLENLKQLKKPKFNELPEEIVERAKKLEEIEPQVISARWVDMLGITLGVYFSWSNEEDPKHAGRGGGGLNTDQEIGESVQEIEESGQEGKEGGEESEMSTGGQKGKVSNFILVFKFIFIPLTAWTKQSA